MNCPKCLLLTGLAVLGLTAPVPAADYYVTAAGAGERTGRSWTDAFAFAAIQDVLNRTMKPGDTVHLEGGTYGRVQLVIDSSGAPGSPKTIVGEDRGQGPPLLGPADEEWMNWGQFGILIKAKSSHWVIKNLGFRLYAEPTVCTEGGHTGLVFDNLRATRCYTGFKLADCHETVLRNCFASRYSQQGFLFVKHCARVTVKNCQADGTPQEAARADVSQVGFQCGGNKDAESDGNAYLTFEDCVSRNNLETDRKQSWVQGDGFVAERSNRHLTFRRCRSFDASDGCFDLKAEIDEFADCVAVGPARCFKLWSQTMTMTNCIAVLTEGGRYRTTGTRCALEVNNRGKNGPLGGRITAQSCTFDVRSPVPAVWGESGRATLNDCILCLPDAQGCDGAAEPQERDVTVTFNRTAIHREATKSNPARFLNPAPDWDGTGSNYDSRTHGLSKGYHSSRVAKPH